VSLVEIGLCAGLVTFVICLIGRQTSLALAGLVFTLVCIGVNVVLLWPMVQRGEWWIVHCNIDPWPIITTYIGLALAGAMFLAIGLLVSSLVTSQMIAAIVSLFIGLLFIGGMWSPELDTSELPYKLVFFFSVPMHFERHFARGLIDTRHLVLYGSVALFGLFLTVRSLESRRWR